MSPPRPQHQLSLSLTLIQSKYFESFPLYRIVFHFLSSSTFLLLLLKSDSSNFAPRHGSGLLYPCPCLISLLSFYLLVVSFSSSDHTAPLRAGPILLVQTKQWPSRPGLLAISVSCLLLFIPTSHYHTPTLRPKNPAKVRGSPKESNKISEIPTNNPQRAARHLIKPQKAFQSWHTNTNTNTNTNKDTKTPP